MLVKVSEAGELSGELGRARRGGLAAGAEVAAAEEVGGGDYGGAHGPVLVGALRPGEVAIDPEVEAHEWMVARRGEASGEEALDRGREFLSLEGLVEREPAAKGGCIGGIGERGDVEQRDAGAELGKGIGRVGHQEIDLAGAEQAHSFLGAHAMRDIARTFECRA